MLSLKAQRKRRLKYRSLLMYRRFLEELRLKEEQERLQSENKKEHKKTVHFIHLTPFRSGDNHGK